LSLAGSDENPIADVEIEHDVNPVMVERTITATGDSSRIISDGIRPLFQAENLGDFSEERHSLFSELVFDGFIVRCGADSEIHVILPFNGDTLPHPTMKVKQE